jgi:CPA1 family monovalent cation:H+ antiporter
MSLFTIFAILITVTAFFSYLNERVFRLPTTIGVMLGAMGTSVVLIALDRLGLAESEWARQVLRSADFDELLLEGMLSFLLFAGALHVELEDLFERKWFILACATGGVILSTLIVGSATWWILRTLGLGIPFEYALVFGALISPTDPIAVLGILKKAGTPKRLETLITGESLFNDGVGVVVFLVLVGLTTGKHEVSLPEGLLLFAQEALGGAAFGLVLGLVGFILLRGVDNYKVEVLLTLAVVAGGYALAGSLHVSGPIAMVVAGLFIGNHGRLFAMSDRTREHLDDFWELVDEILNAILFVLIGLEILDVSLEGPWMIAGSLAIPIVLLARLVSVGLPVNLFRVWTRLPPFTVTVMTWGGLRGGISIALALSLPPSPERDHILVLTYIVVVFSIVVQGLSVGKLARWVALASPPLAPDFRA